MGKHAIIVLKNKEDKYLQYYEKNWNSYLFLNCKMNDLEDFESINNKIKELLNIESSDYECVFIGEKVHRKFSEKDKIEKEYTHYFYKIKLLEDFAFLNENEFEISNVKYKWFSYDELKNDKRIQEVNSDIVGFIKEFDL